MSTESTPSPLQGPVRDIDESRLPQGQCRYILLVPEIKGHRCACVGFSLNRAMPSATCDCGHLACYHVKTVEPTTDKHEVDRLKQRIHELEDQLEGEKAGSLRSMVTRVSQLEELVEKSREEALQLIQASSRHIGIAMHDIAQLRTQTAAIQGHVGGVEGRVEELQNGQMELQDADDWLGERVGALENVIEGPFPTRGRQPPASMSESTSRDGQTTLVSRRRRSSASRSAAGGDTPPIQAGVFPQAATSMPFRGPSIIPTPSSASWTAHISLLPSRNRPFPFEKDTNAYKRCLSRGLHQIVVISGPSAEAFVEAVGNAFGDLLRGRPWMPLQAELCDYKTLQGLPMLRQLGSDLVDHPYDLDFLKAHCAVCEPSGKVDSLYIAMRSETFSWPFLRRSPIYKHGLEDCWQHDEILDRSEDELMDEDERPYAGDIVPNLSLKKRTASEISRSSSFGSASVTAELEGSRPKMPRTRGVPGLDEVLARAQRV